MTHRKVSFSLQYLLYLLFLKLCSLYIAADDSRQTFGIIY